MAMTRQKVTLLAIFMLFFTPLFLVILMQSPFWKYKPAMLEIQGLMILPVVQLKLNDPIQNSNSTSPRDLQGKWLLLYVIGDDCNAECSRDITALRQIHKAAGKNREHLEIAILSKAGPDPGLRSRLEAIYPQLNFIDDPASTALSKLAQINIKIAAENADKETIYTYILDPLHNVILAYHAGTNPSEINKDLKRLLKWSRLEQK